MTVHDGLILLGRVNLAAAAGVLLAAILRKPVRTWAGARLAYGLWLLPWAAGVAMLAPPRSRDLFVTPAPQISVPIFHSEAMTSAPMAPVSPPLDPDLLLVAAWLGGVGVAIIIMAWLQARFSADVRDGLTGPAVVGVVRPRVVVPAGFETDFEPDEQALVLAHEHTHIARQDSRLNGLLAAVQCLFWFNPLIHLAAYLSRVDQEMACDEAVITRFPEARHTYAHALVKAQLAIRPLPLGCYWPSGTEHPLLERIAMLKHQAFSPTRRLAGATALVVLCTTAAAAAWASQPASIRTVRLVAPSMVAMQAPARLADPATVAAKPALVQLASAAPTPLPAPETAPQAAKPAVPVLASNQYADLDLGAPASASGVLTRVEWVNPSVMIHIQDPSTGQETIVATSTPNSALRAGGSRDSLKMGMPVSVNGYRSSKGGYLYANLLEFSSNGQPMFPTAPAAGEGEKMIQRQQACGVMPNFMAQFGPPTDEAGISRLNEAADGWVRDCDAKIAAQDPAGAVTSYSAVSNSVVRSGSGK